ncbi:MAG TPA: glucokinase [Prochlorococcus sp.]|tara:strand:+ start:3228 stop:4301 length:1074 start_codon:yes stop_codon:yes gene_type:complete
MVAPTTFLAGDLGGTKTLLALYRTDENQLRQQHQRRYISTEWSSLEPMLNDFIAHLPTGMEKPNNGCIAVAGPVSHGEAEITNLPWSVKEKNLCATTGLKQLELINDFGVLIHGLPFLNANQQVELQLAQQDIPAQGPVAILGAGTGLGMARGLTTKDGMMALASEGGHREFAPRSESEWRLCEWLKADLQLKRLSLERIVSGTGLGHVVRWRLQQSDADGHPLRQIANVWRHGADDYPGHPDLPALASQAANDGDLLINEALQLWLGAYGSAAGDLALQELCTGGLWVAGGTAAKQLQGLRSKTFLEAFRNKGRFRKFLEELPVMAIIDPEAGLFSAACRARTITEQGGKLNQVDR